MCDLPASVQTEIKDLWVLVHPLKFEKCVRCWHQCEDVGLDAAHPQLCARCVSNAFGTGEVRRYA